jgi:hypothetical protein
MEQARPTCAWIGHRSDDLAVSGFGAFCRVLERLHLGVAANKLRVAPSSRALQPRTQRAEAGYLINLWFGPPLTLVGPIDLSWKYPSTSFRVASLTTTEPDLATACIRETRFVVCPIGSYST